VCAQDPPPVQALIKRLAEGCNQLMHEFWTDEQSPLDRTAFDSTRIHGPRQISDACLLALTVQPNWILVTFDAGISLTAVNVIGLSMGMLRARLFAGASRAGEQTRADRGAGRERSFQQMEKAGRKRRAEEAPACRDG
jgi:hypothetical protein